MRPSWKPSAQASSMDTMCGTGKVRSIFEEIALPSAGFAVEVDVSPRYHSEFLLTNGSVACASTNAKGMFFAATIDRSLLKSQGATAFGS